MTQHSQRFHELIIGDPNGHHLRLTGDGIFLWGGPLTLRASLSLDRGMPELTLYDGNSQDRITLKVYAPGDPGLAFSDGNGTQRLTCGVTGDGTPGLLMKDVTGTRRLELEVDKDGVPYVDLYDEDERQRLEVSLVDEEGMFAIYDDEGKQT
jgi:hypothetical protein